MRKIKITAGAIQAIAELNDSATANAIWEALPIKARANTWGDEIYFGIPVHVGEENGKEVVDMGDIAYWPPGSAFCIFFGPTPASRGSEIRPASAVNVVGKIEGDPKVFKSVRSGEQVILEKLEE
ncbi:MAG: cyclophilin-like fold protein [Armatimonadota bacterium]|nr:cyclophilin-like fold protein [Armatimonadota bacterium]